MTAGAELYIGLISGTSMDGIDAALVDFTGTGPRTLATHEHPIPAPLKQELLALCAPGDNEINRTGAADRRLGALFAEAASELLAATGTAPTQVRAIGCHGQTIRHLPPSPTQPAATAFTLQIGDPTTIAELTGIPVAADFRRRDIAAGGQGAPLAPAFHHAVFDRAGEKRAVINIGGMSNVTLLDGSGGAVGFDCGPGNVLMDCWARRHIDCEFDRDGNWASQGAVDSNLLQQLLREPYFALPPPKSTGRELFDDAWLRQQLQQYAGTPSPADVQATLLELTAVTIAQALQPGGGVDQVYICGGGAYNAALMRRLNQLLQPVSVESTALLGVEPAWVEAIAFAWLAKRCLDGTPGNLPAVTGASRAVILGAIYQA